MPSRILIVDDEPNILGTVAPLLRSRGYEVLSAMTDERAWMPSNATSRISIVLDLGLPDMDGVDVCRQMRQATGVPTRSLGSRRRRRQGGGASTLAPMTTSPSRLAPRNCWRAFAALRRVDGPSPSSEPIVRGGLVIDRERFRVLRDGEEVRLTPKEFEFLIYLAQHQAEC